VTDALESRALVPRFVLTATETETAAMLQENPYASTLIVAGALPEIFLASLARGARRAGRSITVIAADPTRVFLSDHSVDFYRRAGVELMVLRPIELLALTVNPVAPQSHSFDSARLRALLAEELDDVPIFDVRHPEYRGSQPAAPR
jgi:hypothetical protein